MSKTSDEVSNVASSEASRDCSEQLYTLVNEVTGEVDGEISLDSLLAGISLLELDEMPITEFSDDLKAGDLAEVVVIRPEKALNASPTLGFELKYQAEKYSQRRHCWRRRTKPIRPSSTPINCREAWSSVPTNVG
ncbi:hypothetical protein PC129_g18776 [Phytophthora cactorum]|uniref:Uncharacterized protein n=1 Tax=Phytophthora cactorum TaxID=29920 RepID=A0A329RGN0_9STRA|nr:hypothetical protein Pcac1_g18050 [Phytophthora cactorum]KAG2880949.1 hypothetical protein PC114_g21813 [Phytophthora cactorum]KAG2890731.1 hypothetical protein PC115_g19414 [Phytophthora cactorum]KAG2903104.1 hypothetical protein PC117_g21314 [Phytophthora cactorum]KAG2966529.1 hypothetical protein PC118_g19125 [Phytophthora cactorum]